MPTMVMVCDCGGRLGSGGGESRYRVRCSEGGVVLSLGRHAGRGYWPDVLSLSSAPVKADFSDLPWEASGGGDAIARPAAQREEKKRAMGRYDANKAMSSNGAGALICLFMMTVGTALSNVASNLFVGELRAKCVAKTQGCENQMMEVAMGNYFGLKAIPGYNRRCVVCSSCSSYFMDYSLEVMRPHKNFMDKIF